MYFIIDKIYFFLIVDATKVLISPDVFHLKMKGNFKLIKLNCLNN